MLYNGVWLHKNPEVSSIRTTLRFHHVDYIFSQFIKLLVLVRAVTFYCLSLEYFISDLEHIQIDVIIVPTPQQNTRWIYANVLEYETPYLTWEEASFWCVIFH